MCVHLRTHISACLFVYMCTCMCAYKCAVPLLFSGMQRKVRASWRPLRRGWEEGGVLRRRGLRHDVAFKYKLVGE